MRRDRILLIALLCLPAVCAATQDPAYVDGPAGASYDPARADGGSVLPGDPRPARAGAAGNPQAMLMQMQLQMAQRAMADAQQAQAAQPGAAPTPMQQIGAGLAQDAGNLVDAGLQRQIAGPDGRVLAAPASQSMPANMPGANMPGANQQPGGEPYSVDQPDPPGGW